MTTAPLPALADAVGRYADARPGASPYATAIDGLVLLRSAVERHPAHLLHKPTLCVVAQGAKQTAIGDTVHTYRAGQALVVTVDAPGVSEVTEASDDAPYLSVVVGLDPAVMADVLASLDAPPAPARTPPGAFVLDLDDALTDAVLRAVRLLDTPDAVPLLYPALQREVGYRLLTGPRGAEVAALTAVGGRAPDVVRAVRALRERFAEAVPVRELAEIARLSPSAFHRRFKAMTATTPLQYQKRLRLLEARRLMVSDDETAERAARRVGYESPSQFSRDYARAFGAPPRRDVATVRAAAP